jgi:hypothetical protein
MESEAAEKSSRVRIHIDRVRHDCSNPTTNEELYVLGKVHKDYHLYREARGDHEDQLIPRDREQIRLTEDEHFYSAEDHKKGIKIIVNARQDTVYHHRISYEQVVKLAYPTPPSNEVIGYTVTFYKGHEHKHEGHLTAGQRVRVCNGMVFNVTPVNRS